MFAANSLPRRNAVSFPFSATVADHGREFFFKRGGGYRSLLSWAGRFGSVEGGNVIWVSKMRRGQSTPLPSPRRAIVQGFRFMSLRTCATRWRGGDSAGIYIYIKAGDAEGNSKDDRPLLFRTTTTKRAPWRRPAVSQGRRVKERVYSSMPPYFPSSLPHFVSRLLPPR